MTVMDRKTHTRERPGPRVVGQAQVGPAPEREPPAFAWLVLVGGIFGLAVVKELGRAGGPALVKVRSLPPHPAPFLAMGMLGRIGARVMGLR